MSTRGLPPKLPRMAPSLHSAVLTRLYVASLALITFDLFVTWLFIGSSGGNVTLLLFACGAAVTLALCYRTIRLACIAVREWDEALMRARKLSSFRFRLYALDGCEVRVFDDPLEWRRFVATHKPAYEPTIRDSTVGELNVRTVLLSCDHRRRDASALVLFETMVFDGQGKPIDLLVRYSTYAEALDGHATVVESLRLLELDAIDITRATLDIVRGGLARNGPIPLA